MAESIRLTTNIAIIAVLYVFLMYMVRYDEFTVQETLVCCAAYITTALAVLFEQLFKVLKRRKVAWDE